MSAMRRWIATLATLVLLGCVFEAWAGPAEEVLQFSKPRLQALQDGDLDAYTAAYADNAVFYSSLSAFRIEGKEAIRAYFAEVFKLYPTRHFFSRQPVIRAYNDDLVVQNGYGVLYLTDPKGQLTTVHTRSSVTWARIEGRWQIVDQHTSRVPIAP